ncbi:hypothetical protein JRO89_XS01G0078900 [Xanthoceras sorbifolium]|uniref:Uncharacterized protein n=1 Tax=Xanthoceras sorbifolium TaxID=99658 RepID=A0ABQ8IJ32_9ROSI|nr:hypothetical protein JRO89_XS01G0078900 [Xanthoceras sorbifolium]
MSEENVDEWDADFLEQLIQVEELALSSLPPQPPLSHNLSLISYSPPRHLSQRTSPISHHSPSDNAKDLQIHRLKRELGRVSKQLVELEHECLQLKNERNKKEEVINFASSNNDKKDANVCHLKPTTNLKDKVTAADLLGVSQEFQTAKALDEQISCQFNKASPRCKEIGIQTDLLHHLDLSKKLQDIWGFPSDQTLGKNLISKLFVACSLEFHVLFGCMNVNTSSNSLAVETSADIALQCHIHSYPSAEAAKLSQLYSMLTKIGNGMVQLEALIEPLLDLCGVENVAIVNRSLRILHVFLKHLLTLDRKAEASALLSVYYVLMNFDLIFQCTLLRDNVMIEGHQSRNNIGDFHGANSATNRLFCRRGDEASCAGCIMLGIISPEADGLCKKAYWSSGRAAGLSYIDWVSIFELMNQIALRNTEEYVRSEAVSIMNMIVMSSYSYMDREKFGQPLVFDNISQLLRKEAGLHVQKVALHLLYLLLNYLADENFQLPHIQLGPKIFAALCSECEDGENAGAANQSYKNPSANKAFIMILEGLADCIACSGNGVQDLELRRNAVVVLAFLASSGKCGFEGLVNHKLCREANFLMLILQVLVSEIDMEAAAHNVNADILRARTLLIREALILLNRLVSNPAYAAIVLQVLTSSRDMASLTIDVANRLSRKDQRMRKSDSTTRQMRESEVVDLGRVFRRRVFTYLGDST